MRTNFYAGMAGMVRRSVAALFVVAAGVLHTFSVAGQDLSGVWQGVNYAPTSNITDYWPILLTISQDGNKLTGQCLEAAGDQEEFFVLWDVTNGTTQNNAGSFDLTDILDENKPDGTTWCTGTFKFTFSPGEEKIQGTIAYTNGVCAGLEGVFELYRITFKSPSKYCREATPELLVTGKDVKWYADERKQQQLATGNTYTPPALQATTTFYVTQTYYGTETPAVPFTVEVSDAAISDIEITPANCSQDNGAIRITAAGMGDISYQLDEGAFQASQDFTGLKAGVHELTIRDSLGCEVTQSITVTLADQPVIDNVEPVNPQCSKENGQLVVTASGGSGQLTYSLNGTDFQNDGFFEKLGAGSYVMTIKDETGCRVEYPVILSNEAGIVFNAINIEDSRCDQADGSISVAASGGSGLLTFSIDGLDFNASGIFNNLGAGRYSVSVKDQNECIVTADTVVAETGAPQIKSVQKQNTSCNAGDGGITVVAEGNSALTYSLDNALFVANPDFRNLAIGTYEITVQDEALCTAKQSVTIETDCRNTVFIPAAFSPDGNSKNDALTIRFPFSELRVTSFSLFDRWGTVIKNMGSQSIESGYELWDGTYQGRLVPAGAYPYVLTVEFADGKTQQIRDTIFLVK